MADDIATKRMAFLMAKQCERTGYFKGDSQRLSCPLGLTSVGPYTPTGCPFSLEAARCWDVLPSHWLKWFNGYYED